MAGRSRSQCGTNASKAGLFLLGWLAALSAAAAPALETRCDEPAEPIVEAAATELNARTASSSEQALEGRIPESQIDTAARRGFADDEADESEAEDEAAADPTPIEAGGPTASDREPSPFRRQMYRRDI